MRTWPTRVGSSLLVVVTVCAAAGCGGEPVDVVAADGGGGSVGGEGSVRGSVAGVVLPPAGGRFSYQIGGAYAVPAGVEVVSRDRTDAAADGAYSICYVNAFQAQPDAVGWWEREHPDLLLRNASGDLVIDEEWDEPLLDHSTDAKRAALTEVVGGWLEGCAADGFRAVEADNLDAFLRSDGLLDADDALEYSRLLAERAHSARLAIGQKNAAELAAQAKDVGFDFAVAEECEVYAECGDYTEVYGDQLIEVEYTDQDEAAFERACRDRGDSVSVTRRDRDVLPAGEAGHVEQWCD